MNVLIMAGWWKNVWNSIETGFMSAILWLWSGVYNAAAFAFRIFLLLANGSIVDSSDYETLIKNIYIILGVVMLFVIAFALLQSMVNPDDQKVGASAIRKMVTNFITSLIIIVLLPSIFTFLFDVQTSVLNFNSIGKFFGFNQSTNNGTSVESAANQIVNGVWTAFFNVSESYIEESGCTFDTTDSNHCQALLGSNGTNEDYLYNVINAVDGGDSFTRYGQFVDYVVDGTIDFNGLISLAAGVLLIWVGASYCFDMALRLIKLIFYQLIAPIPVLLRIVPNEKISGTFNQWMKITLSCYFEVYVRILVMYFCVYICSLVINSTWLKNITSNNGFLTGLFTKAFLLMGIVMFMKQAPKLIGEVTGIDSGGMKLGIKDKLKEGGAFALGAVAGGALTAGVRNAVVAGRNVKNAEGFGHKLGAAFRGVGSVAGGTLSGGARSVSTARNAGGFREMAQSAATGAQGATDARDRRANYKAAHGNSTFRSIGGHIADAGRGIGEWAGFNSLAGLQSEKAAADEMMGFYDTMAGYVSDDKMVAQVEGEYRALAEKEIATEETIFDEEAYNNAITANLTQMRGDRKYSRLSTEQLRALATSQVSKDSFTTIHKFTDSELAQHRQERADKLEMLDNMKKIYTMKAINEKLNDKDAEGKIIDGRFQTVANQVETFKKQNASYDFVNNMSQISGVSWKSEWDDALKSNDPTQIKDLMKNFKQGTDSSGNQMVGFFADKETAKIKSSEVSAEIAKKVQEQKGNDKK